MSTKNEPGPFDCLNKLAPDEPYFILRGQDELAPDVVERWVSFARVGGTCPNDKLNEALRIAEAMRAWPRQKKPD